MDKFRGKYRIESNRWQYWDYSAPAAYFITICTTDRQKMFGHIQNAKMILSPQGEIVAEHIAQIPTYHKRIVLDEWIIMPNHLHWIIILGEYDFDNGISSIEGGELVGWRDENVSIDAISYRKLRRKMLIGKIIGKFKMQSSKQINILNQNPRVENWQHDYHDHVIRNTESYYRIKSYIANNPANWDDDMFYEP